MTTIKKPVKKTFHPKDGVPFSKLTKEEKRRAIIEDVIYRVRRGDFSVTKNVYLNITDAGINESEQLNKHFGDAHCETCAIGCLFLAKVDKNNHYTISEANNAGYTEIAGYLRGIFSKYELALIEAAFEGTVIQDEKGMGRRKVGKDMWGCDIHVFYMSDAASSAIEFGKKYRSPKRRLIAIMENMLENSTVFVP